MNDLGSWAFLLEREFLITAFTAIAAFATILTFALPYFQGSALEVRMKAVAQRREELRQKQREALAQSGKRGSLRSTPIGFMKSTLDNLKLEKLLESPGMKEKLARAGYPRPGAARHLHVLPLSHAAGRLHRRADLCFRHRQSGVSADGEARASPSARRSSATICPTSSSAIARRSGATPSCAPFPTLSTCC